MIIRIRGIPDYHFACRAPMTDETQVSDPRLHHAANWVSRFCANGIAVADFNDILGSLASWDDWCRAWSERASVHEALGLEALALAQFVSAGEHLSRAAVT